MASYEIWADTGARYPPAPDDEVHLHLDVREAPGNIHESPQGTKVRDCSTAAEVALPNFAASDDVTRVYVNPSGSGTSAVFRHLPDMSHLPKLQEYIACKHQGGALNLRGVKKGPFSDFLPLRMPPSLKCLALDNNHLEELPDKYGDMQQLEELTLSRCSFEVLPQCITRLAALKILTLNEPYKHGLDELPAEIAQCCNLEELDLVGHKLHTLPSSVAGMSKLVSIDLSRNSFTAIPDCFPPSLVELNLSSNYELEFVPHSLGPHDVVNLKSLVLSYSRISDLEKLRLLMATVPQSTKVALGGNRLLPNKISTSTTAGAIARYTGPGKRAASSSQDATPAEATTCVVCIGEAATHALVPCGHRCLCEACADQIMRSRKRCPLCQTDVTMQLRIFG